MNRKQIIAILCLIGVICSSWNNGTEWKIFSTPGGQLEIQTPIELKERNMPVPEGVKDKVETLVMYTASIDNQFSIVLNETKYKSSVTASLEEAAKGSINRMKGIPNVSDLSFEQRATKVSGYPAILLKGSYNFRDLKTGFLSMMIYKESTHDMFMVMVIYNEAGEEHAENATKVIQSIKVKTN